MLDWGAQRVVRARPLVVHPSTLTARGGTQVAFRKPRPSPFTWVLGIAREYERPASRRAARYWRTAELAADCDLSFAGIRESDGGFVRDRAQGRSVMPHDLLTKPVPHPDILTSWLVRMRWGAFAGQVLIILAARPLFDIALPVGVLLAVAATLGATNVAVAWTLGRRRRLSSAWRGAILAFDTLELTALLYISGGTANPFSVFYLAQITMAAVTLGSRWTWSLAVLGVSSYAALFLIAPGSTEQAAAHAAHLFAQHLVAMWIALTLSAALTTYFVTRLTSALAERDAQITAMRDSATRHERLGALTTLAAGAAHELATPLATVALAAGELDRLVAGVPQAGALAIKDEVQVIRAGVRRCRDILDGMAADFGDAGEMPSAFSAADLLGDIRSGLSRPDHARLRTGTIADAAFWLPRRAVARAVHSLVRNALDASAPPREASIDIAAGRRLEVRVRDDGDGMSPDVLARAGDPFFTTKPPGCGMGLGLFLVRSLAERLSGDLEIESAPGHGTTVRLHLPVALDRHGDSV